jgi:hypothetical protein
MDTLKDIIFNIVKNVHSFNCGLKKLLTFLIFFPDFFSVKHAHVRYCIANFGHMSGIAIIVRI